MTASNSIPIDKSGKSTSTQGTSKEKSESFSEEERAAMQERVQEIKASMSGKPKAYPLMEVLAKIAEMPEPDRAMAGRLHELIQTHVPALAPKLWYGMPAYSKDGKVVCFFQNSRKFKTRYSTLGFNDSAKLDEGDFWPVAYALKALTAAEEQKIIALVKKAAS